MSSDPKAAAAKLSIVSNASLTVLKVVTGLLTGSISILAEAIHSGLDLAAAVIAFYAVKVAAKPFDENHHYGHGKVENVSGVIEAMLIFIAAVWIVWESVEKIFHPTNVHQPVIGVLIMGISAGANIFVSRHLFKVAEEYDSEALRADAWHLRTDVYTSIGVLIALALTWVGGMFLPAVNLAWLDPACAMLVALLIIKASYDLVVSSGRDLLDERLPQEQQDQVKELLDKLPSPVVGYHKLRTRKSGANPFIDLHLEFESGLSLEQAKAVCENVESEILRLLPRASVTIHAEPFSYKNQDD